MTYVGVVELLYSSGVDAQVAGPEVVREEALAAISEAEAALTRFESQW